MGKHSLDELLQTGRDKAARRAIHFDPHFPATLFDFVQLGQIVVQ
jgi:hypothetical protein